MAESLTGPGVTRPRPVTRVDRGALTEPTPARGRLDDWYCPNCKNLMDRHALAPGSVVQIKCGCNKLYYWFQTVVGFYVVAVDDVVYTDARHR